MTVATVLIAVGPPAAMTGAWADAASTGPLLYASTTNIVFPNTDVGGTSAVRSVTIENLGTDPLTELAFYSTPSFPIDSSACGTELAPGASCRVEVRFAPQPDAFTWFNKLDVLTSASYEQTLAEVDLDGFADRGTGPDVDLSRSNAFFQPVAIGSASAIEHVTVRNDGDTASGPITVSPIAVPFTMVSDTCTGPGLAPQAECDLGYQFTAPSSAPETVESVLTAGTQQFPIDLFGNDTPRLGYPFPTAHDDAYSVQAGHTLQVTSVADGLTGNDDNNTNAPFAAVTGWTQPAHGTLTMHGALYMPYIDANPTFYHDGEFSYTPDPGFVGTDTFDYTVADNYGPGSSAIVRITVTALPGPFIQAGYQDFLDRAPTDAELAGDTAALQAGTTTPLRWCRSWRIRRSGSGSSWIGSTRPRSGGRPTPRAWRTGRTSSAAAGSRWCSWPRSCMRRPNTSGEPAVPTRRGLATSTRGSSTGRPTPEASPTGWAR